MGSTGAGAGAGAEDEAKASALTGTALMAADTSVGFARFAAGPSPFKLAGFADELSASRLAASGAAAAVTGSVGCAMSVDAASIADVPFVTALCCSAAGAVIACPGCAVKAASSTIRPVALLAVGADIAEAGAVVALASYVGNTLQIQFTTIVAASVSTTHVISAVMLA